MALVTGTPVGLIEAQDDLYVDKAPSIYFQDATADELNRPDGDGFYWGLSGTTVYPVFSLGCYTDVRFMGNVEMQNVRCDTVGDKGTIQRLNFLDLTFSLQTLFPLATLRHIMRAGAVTTTPGATEKMGIGQPNNQRYYHVYFPVVYDEDAGDYVCVTGHKCQFVDSWQIAFAYGRSSTIGVTIRMFADDAKPSAQTFATVIRADPSAI